MVNLEELTKVNSNGISLGPLRDVRLTGGSESAAELAPTPTNPNPEELKESELAGYQRGKQDAKEEVEQRIAQIQSEYKTKQKEEISRFLDGIQNDLGHKVPGMLKSLEKHVINLAADIAVKLVGEMPISRELVESMVRDALRQVEQDTNVTVLMHTEDLELLEKEKSPLLNQSQGASKILFKPSPNINRGGCMLETKFGVLDAQRETKVELLKKVVGE